MKTIVALWVLLFTTTFISVGQHTGLTFKEAESRGIKISELESLYMSAIHVDTSQAVFKTDKQQEVMSNAYVKLLQDFGKFLTDNNFHWTEPTKCFNRIYFKSDGSIDYFLFNFTGMGVNRLPAEKEIEFTRLLNQFIKDYKIQVTADRNFAQCSPVTYKPKDK